MTSTLLLLRDLSAVVGAALLVVTVALVLATLARRAARYRVETRARHLERRIRAADCANDHHCWTVDAETARIVERCIWCQARQLLGVAYYTGTNRKARRQA